MGLSISDATELLATAYDAALTAFTQAHRSLYTPGELFVDDRLVSALFPTKLLVCREVVDALSKYMITPHDLQVFAQLFAAFPNGGPRVCEIGRLLGVNSYCLSSLGAKVTSVDANGCDDWVWPVTIRFDENLLRCSLPVKVRELIVANKILNVASHILLSNRCTLIDKVCTASMCAGFDIVFEDIWKEDVEDDALVDELCGLVKNEQIQWLVVHDVREFHHVYDALQGMLRAHELSAVYAGECAVVYRHVRPDVHGVDEVDAVRWSPKRRDYSSY